MPAFGVPLRTTETEITVVEPSTQWEESINGALSGIGNEARRRLMNWSARSNGWWKAAATNRLRNSAPIWSGSTERGNLWRRRPGLDPLFFGVHWRRHGSLGEVRGGLGNYDPVRREIPLGTLVINVTGSFLIGFLMTMLTERFRLDPNWRLLLVV
jgi:hypothetical protein